MVDMERMIMFFVTSIQSGTTFRRRQIMFFKKARGFQILLIALTSGIALLLIVSTESARAQGVDIEANKLLVRSAVEEFFNQKNLDAADEFLTVDCIQHEPDGSVTVGIENIKQVTMGLFNGFPDLRIAIDDVIAEGDKVIGRFTNYFGTHQGEFAGMPPTGNEVTFIAIATFRIANGKIAEILQRPDFLGIFEQLGVVPPTRENYEWGTPSQVTGDPGDPETNKATMQYMFDEAFANRNLALIDELFAADFIMHDPVYPIIGPEGYKQSGAMYFMGFPDLQITIEDMIAEGDKVAIPWTQTGTHTGEFMGIPATGRQMTMAGISIFRFADSKIVEIWASYDAMGMMQQLTMPQEQYNKALIVRAWEEIFNQGNLDAADEILAPDYVVHNTAGAPDGHTPDALKQTVVMQRNAFPDIHTTVVDQVAEGDMVVSRWIGTGTHKGELMGIPPTGVQITNTGILLSRVADGKIAEEWSNYDQLGMMQQLGVIPRDREDFSWGVPSQVTGDPGDPATNKAIIQRLYDEVWNGGNLDAVDEIFSADFVYHDPTHPYFTDLEGYKQFIAMTRVEWPDIHITTNQTVAEEDKVACYGTISGTHEGGAFGIPKTGKWMSWTAKVIYRFADGKVVEAWYCGDMMGLWQQLGLIPPMMKDYSNVFFMPLAPGLNMISLPLESAVPFTARSLAEHISATMVIRYDHALRRFAGFTLAASGDGFPIRGGEGYIVNVPGGGMVAFVGAPWTRPPMPAAPPAQRDSAWAFVVSGSVLDGEEVSTSDGDYTVAVRNLRTGEVFMEMADPTGYFAAASADLTRRAIVKAGDKLEVSVVDSNGKLASGPFVYEITLEGIRDAVLDVRLKLGHIIPEKSVLLQNYPNPFNPETWIPYHLQEASPVVIKIHNSIGQVVRALDLGYRGADVYVSRSKAAYWDGRNETGEEVASGIYFYSITAGDFSATRKMTVTK
jgi:steroid delta-isomerase-like uncharacterized protein